MGGWRQLTVLNFLFVVAKMTWMLSLHEGPTLIFFLCLLSQIGSSASFKSYSCPMQDLEVSYEAKFTVATLPNVNMCLYPVSKHPKNEKKLLLIAPLLLFTSLCSGNKPCVMSGRALRCLFVSPSEHTIQPPCCCPLKMGKIQEL